MEIAGGTPATDPMVPVRLRAVNVATVSALLTISALLIYSFLPGRGEIERGPFHALLAVATASTIIVWRLPWPRFMAGPKGLVLLYAWTALYTVTISAILAVTGGGQSMLFPLYTLTLVYSAVLYPRRGFLAELALIVVAYLSVVAVGEPVGVGVVAIRLAILGVLAVMGGFLSHLVADQVAALATARLEADGRAALLAAVAATNRSIASLEPDEVLRSVVDAVGVIGFSARSLCVFEEGSQSYTVVHPQGVPEAYAGQRHPADRGMPGLVRAAAKTVVVDDYSAHPAAVPVLREVGVRTAVGVPISVDDRIAAVLVGGSLDRRAVGAGEIEAMELLAAQAGTALENATRYRAQQLAIEQLAELDRLKQDFVANVSHELRTPLTVIRGLGQTLHARWDALDDAMRVELISRLNANAQSLSETVDTVLDFARLEAGHVRIHAERVDLGVLVTRAVHRLGPLFDGRSLTTSIETGLWVEADPALLERVCENLLANASKHTPEGAHVQVDVRAESGEARLTVRDDGDGIPAAELAHLGERFYRGGDVHTRRTRGTGLGLAFVREILELHGSALDVTSVVGAGSAFGFAFPLATTVPLAPSVVAGERGP